METSGRRARRTVDLSPGAPRKATPPDRSKAPTRRPPGAPTIRDAAMEPQVVLNHAITHRHRVVIELRGDAARGAREVEGTPLAFRPSRDGRQRVVVAIAEGAEQVVLIERIVSVRLT